MAAFHSRRQLLANAVIRSHGFKRSLGSAAVRTTELPCVEYVFYFIEGECFVPDGLRYIDISVKGIHRALIFEAEK
jgi:hypothetical protein